MLMRVRGESAEEIAGFVDAARMHINAAAGAGAFSVDWPSYAGKRKRLPWFLLAARLLARSDRRILLHGADTEVEGRLRLSEAVQALSIPTCADVRACVNSSAPLVYLPLAHLAPALHELLHLRRLLGLRSPIHTTVRMLNPLRAEWSLQSVFHPNYVALHVAAAQQLQDPQVLVLKGEAGEFECDPGRPAPMALIRNSVAAMEVWDATFVPTPGIRRERPPLAHLRAVWDGTAEDTEGVASIQATCAIILHALERLEPAAARAAAQRLWRERSDSVRAMPAPAPPPPQ